MVLLTTFRGMVPPERGGVASCPSGLAGSQRACCVARLLLSTPPAPCPGLQTYGISPDELLALNPQISNPDSLALGAQQLPAPHANRYVAALPCVRCACWLTCCQLTWVPAGASTAPC